MSKKHIESEMRDSTPPKIETVSDLGDYVQSLIDGEHDYGTCVYAMSLAATAAFNLVAGKLGVTGYQASCADMDIIRRTRHIEGPFAIVNGEDGLYPQYSFATKHPELAEKWRDWLKEEARKLLDEDHGMTAAPAVMEHWKKLAHEGEAE